MNTTPAHMPDEKPLSAEEIAALDDEREMFLARYLIPWLEAGAPFVQVTQHQSGEVISKVLLQADAKEGK